MEKFDTTVKSWLSVLDKNKYVSTIISLFLVLYASLAAPRLSPKIAKLFENPIVKIIFVFLIAYSSTKDPTVAIVASIALLVSLNTLTKYKIDDRIAQYLSRTKMAMRRRMDTRVEDNPQNVQIPSEALAKLQNSKMDPGCTKIGKYRNNFYPQYTNMKPDAYQARYTGNVVDGYDNDASYASAY